MYMYVYSLTPPLAHFSWNERTCKACVRMLKSVEILKLGPFEWWLDALMVSALAF